MAQNQSAAVKTPALRGFAAMDPKRQREIASQGGLAVSQDRKHMAAIGAEGGKSRGNHARLAALAAVAPTTPAPVTAPTELTNGEE